MMESDNSLKRMWIWLICLFALYFVYSSCTALFIQLYALPHMFPHMHEGEGLLKYTDSVSFHHFAVELAGKMHREGVSVWSLDPIADCNMQPATLAAISYYLFSPNLWAVIPYNAILHALSGCILFYMAFRLLKTHWQAVIASLPFVVFPSSITWYGQLHRDGLFIIGSYLACLCIFLLTSSKLTPKRITISILCVLLAMVCMFASRDEALPILVLVVGVWLGILILFKIWMTLTVGSFNKNLIVGLAVITVFGSSAVFSLLSEGASTLPQHFENKWKKDAWVPGFMEWRVQEMAMRRQLFYDMHPDSGSNIDADKPLTSFSRVLLYIPRAIQVAYLAPFPKTWFGQGVRGRTFQRRISGLEMSFSYLIMLGLPLSLFYFRKNLQFWSILFFSSVMVLPFAIAIPNVGTLYRIRYGFFMLVVMLGVVGWFSFINHYRNKR